MPYTLVKGLIWVLLAVGLGIVIGWLLRSVVAHRQLARARSQSVDVDEVERLRNRVAELEPLVVDRDRRRSELDVSRADAPVATGPPHDPVTSMPTEGGAIVESVRPPPPDVVAAAEVLGRAIDLDDLTVIEGIGPKIEELCRGIGISSWVDLSTTEVSLLRTMLADAGPRFRSHDPTTWPEQAGLLAAGRWDDFRVLTDGLQGGRVPD